MCILAHPPESAGKCLPPPPPPNTGMSVNCRYRQTLGQTTPDTRLFFRVDSNIQIRVVDGIMQITPLSRAVEHFGNMSKLAAATGYSQHAVWCAVKRNRVSPAMAVAIHKATKGKIKRADLRPDIFGSA